MDTNDLEILNLRSRGSLFVEIRAIRGQEILPEAPTKSLALCKNSHWAMDHDLIAPAPFNFSISKISAFQHLPQKGFPPGCGGAEVEM